MRHLLLILILFSSALSFASSVTVSGLSAGAYMAQQFHMSFSKEVKGVGLIAGGPYYCAKGNIFNALDMCMKANIATPSSTDSIATAKILEKSGEIDPVSNLRSARVYALTGKKDETVARKVADVTIDTYRAWGVSKFNIKYDTTSGVGHAFPTDSFGNSCDTAAKAPYISNCGKDVAGEILGHLLGTLRPRVPAKDSQLFSYDQLSAEEDLIGDKLSLNKLGYAYIPEDCERGTNRDCRIHVAFHGCLQTTDDVGLDFVTKVGYNSWAQANNVIILYPQVKKNLIINPNGCWDWWGYSGPNYHTKSGPQIKVVKRMIEALQSGKLQLNNLNL